ncbi:MAG TPA: acetylxylan esterase [Armatimonadota bacterium]|nr:acetylxylan esterase [Armatimonadota bacterium]
MNHQTHCSIALFALATAIGAEAEAPGDEALPLQMQAYLVREASRISSHALDGIHTAADWEAARAGVRRKLAFMMGLDLTAPRSPLKAHVMGRLEREAFSVEKVTFQSVPGLYVTGNLYVPKGLRGRAPAVLYVCGHGGKPPTGAKAQYQHHGIWLASHGYVTLMIDTLQLGEVGGLHHGTHRENLWNWVSAGYAPGAVEVWNAVRALDYLQSRPEVDPGTIGMTGRSGGGAYTWYTAALDDRVQVAIPVNSANTIYSHIEQDTLRGHCDCMFIHNCYGLDFVDMDACIAPRPLLILESTDDGIFPRQGHAKLYEGLRRLYRLYGAEDRLGYFEHLGGHEDAMEFRTQAFQWLERWLKGKPTDGQVTEVERFEPDELRVFPAGLPADERNSTLRDDFLPPTSAIQASTAAEWQSAAARLRERLAECPFAQWPPEPPGLRLQVEPPEAHDGRLERRISFDSDEGIRLHATISRPVEGKAEAAPLVYVAAADETDETIRARVTAASEGRIVLWFHPRGLEPKGELFVRVNADGTMEPRGPRDWYIERASHLIGRTVPSMRVYDVVRAIDALDMVELGVNSRIAVYGRGPLGVLGLYAGVMDRRIQHVVLDQPPVSHRDHSVILMDILRFADMPQCAALLCPMRLTFLGAIPGEFEFTRGIYELCGHADRFGAASDLVEALGPSPGAREE